MKTSVIVVLVAALVVSCLAKLSSYPNNRPGKVPYDPAMKTFTDHMLFEREKLTDRGILYNNEGRPYMICRYKNGFRACYLPRDKPHGKAIACYALWGDGHIVQDCFIASTESVKQCQKNRCVDSRGPQKKAAHFCCCTGTECNDEYSVA